MRVLMMCLLASVAQAAQVTDLALPIAEFRPMTSADGVKTFRFVILPRGLDEQGVMNLLAQEMGKARWCPDGWDITSRKEVMKRLMIEGRCRESAADSP